VQKQVPDRRRRRPRESLILVVLFVLVIGNGAVEDEKEDEDDLLAAPPRYAVSQVFNLPQAACEQRSADYKSAIRQIKNLRDGEQIPGERGEPSVSYPTERRSPSAN
jgi:hypothetical protein